MNSTLTQIKALQEFFHKKVKEALELQKMSISGEAEFYLVHILSHYSKSENLFQTDSNGKVEYRPLALKLHDSVFSTESGKRFIHLKSLGDTALYHAGVFYDGLYNSIVDVDYYINMGGLAYHSLANLSTHHGKTMADLFHELSVQFAKLVEILHLCCEVEVAHTDNDVLKLLDRYHKTGSEKARGILEEKGILLENLSNTKNMQ